MSERLMRAVFYPLLSVLIIALFAGGLGVLFMLVYGDVHHTDRTIGFLTLHAEWFVVAIGLALVVGVPSVAYWLQRRVERG